MMHNVCLAQESMLEQLLEDNKSYKTSGTFKSARIINGHSVETRNSGVLELIIGHRFGRVNSGIKNFFGLDEAWIRLGLDYAISDGFTIGIGRSSFQKTYDGFAKFKLLNQHQGGGSPITITGLLSAAINTQEPPAGLDLEFKHKLAYVAELLIARKFSEGFSLQFMPVWVHRNLVASPQEQNDLFALGLAGRQKITSRTAFTFEYYLQLNNSTPFQNHNSLGIGVDIETGGHVFQLHFTNARAMIEKEFIANTTGDFWKGDIHFGFNVIRVFQVR
ncbi:MAG: hypothetical protein JJU28_07915 [Cyclobacteriaceae bacterium]|nr:hypothetical protein [Cyclobacteriaceae bacterium]